MPTPNSVTLIVPLPEQDYAAFTAAGRHLVRVMGSEAPDLLALVVHTLRCRDARGLAEDYLESVGWPLENSSADSSINERGSRTDFDREGHGFDGGGTSGSE